MSRVKNRKGRSKVNVGEAASRVVEQVYHTGQGQDERAEARGGWDGRGWPRPGLDSAWSVASNPHRESGTRWRAAADVGQAAGPGRASAPSGEGTSREPFGRLRWGKEGWRYATGGSLFRSQTVRWFPFLVSYGPQI